MELVLLSLPLAFTCLVAVFHSILPMGILILEFLMRIYFTYFICLSYIILISYEIITTSNDSMFELFFINLIYMFNFMNGFVFIPLLFEELACTFLNQIMFITFLSSNILSILYIYKTNYLGLKKFLNRQYFQPYLEDSDISDSEYEVDDTDDVIYKKLN